MNVRTISSMPSPLVETDWLAENLESGDLHVIDCSVVMRPLADGGYTFTGAAEEYAAGHIPGAVFADVLSELSDADSALPMMLPKPAVFAAVMERLGVGTGSRVVLYDRSNHAWAARVWWMLRAYGFDAASVLDGGWLKWSAEQRAVSTQIESYPPGRFEPAYRRELIADKQTVREAIGAADVCLINALSPEEHSGEQGRFPRRGRIADSSNVYCQSLIDPETHAYRDSEQLRELFAASGALNADRTITYCGAGIAASSDALALTALGAKNVAVYDGSLSEWTADSEAPMETG